MEKKKLLERLSEIETSSCRKHPIIITAATTVAAVGAIAIAKGPSIKAKNFIKSAASGMFGIGKETVSPDALAEQASLDLARSAFKGGGSEEAVGLASSGLVSMIRAIVKLT